jgi:undecaprenyl-diphosphatase
VNGLSDADRRLFLLLHSRFRAGWLDAPMIWLTKAGTKGVIWLGLGSGMIVDGSIRGRWAAILSIGALLIAEGLINVVLKPLIRRERPFARRGSGGLLVTVPGPHSWPSAHAGSSAAAALVLAALYPLWGAAFLAIALLIAYSRIYVGVHYPFDVLAGLIVGALAAACVLIIAGVFLSIPHLQAI